MSYNLTLGCSFTQIIEGNYSTNIYPNIKQMGTSGSTNDMLFQTFLENKKVFFESESCLIQMTSPYRFEIWDENLEKKEVVYDQLPRFFSPKYLRYQVSGDTFNENKYVEINAVQVWMKSIWLYQYMIEELLRNSVEVIFLPYMFRYNQTTKPFLIEKNFKFNIDDIKQMFPKNQLLTISEHNPWHYYEIDKEDVGVHLDHTDSDWVIMGYHKNYNVRSDHLSEHQHKLCRQNILKDKEN